jgi:glycosyltransferase involved in cell wall biosynthesis
MLRKQKAIARIVDEGSYDVVFAHNCAVMQSPGLIRYLQTPVVYYCQEPPREIHEPRPSRAYREFSAAQSFGNRFDPFPGIYRRTLARIDRINVRVANTVIVNSDYSREALYRIYGIMARVGYLGVDMTKFQPMGNGKEAFVLSVGALTALKGFDFLIRSLGRVDQALRPQLRIISNYVNTNESDYLIELAESQRVSVKFLSDVSDEELVQAYNEALLTLYSPIMEPFGLVPVESMACGTAVVGVREGGVRESITDGQGGVLVEREESDFAEAVSSLLQDSERREKLGREARLYATSRWGWESAMEKIESILMEAAIR